MPLMDEFKEEREALKHGTLKQKLTYFADYYKWHVIVGVILIAAAVSLISQMLTNKDTAFFAAMINGTALESADGLKSSFAEYAGLDMGKNDIVFDTTMRLSTDPASYYDQNALASNQKLMVYIASAEIDVIVTDEDSMTHYAYNEFFMDLRTLLTEEQLALYEPYFYYVDQAVIDEINAAEDARNYEYVPVYPDPSDPSAMKEPVPAGIYLDDSFLTESFYYGDKRVVAGTTVNTTRPETASTFLEFIMSRESLSQ